MRAKSILLAVAMLSTCWLSNSLNSAYGADTSIRPGHVPANIYDALPQVREQPFERSPEAFRSGFRTAPVAPSSEKSDLWARSYVAGRDHVLESRCVSAVDFLPEGTPYNISDAERESIAKLMSLAADEFAEAINFLQSTDKHYELKRRLTVRQLMSAKILYLTRPKYSPSQTSTTPFDASVYKSTSLDNLASKDRLFIAKLARQCPVCLKSDGVVPIKTEGCGFVSGRHELHEKISNTTLPERMHILLTKPYQASTSDGANLYCNRCEILFSDRNVDKDCASLTEENNVVRCPNTESWCEEQ